MGALWSLMRGAFDRATATTPPRHADAQTVTEVTMQEEEAQIDHEHVIASCEESLAAAREGRDEAKAVLNGARARLAQEQAELPRAIGVDDREQSDLSASAVAVARVRIERSARAVESAERNVSAAESAVTIAEAALERAMREKEIARLTEAASVETLRERIADDVTALVELAALAAPLARALYAKLEASRAASRELQSLGVADEPLDVAHILIPFFDVLVADGLVLPDEAWHRVRHAAEPREGQPFEASAAKALAQIVASVRRPEELHEVEAMCEHVARARDERRLPGATGDALKDLHTLVDLGEPGLASRFAKVATAQATLRDLESSFSFRSMTDADMRLIDKAREVVRNGGEEGPPRIAYEPKSDTSRRLPGARVPFEAKSTFTKIKPPPPAVPVLYGDAKPATNYEDTRPPPIPTSVDAAMNAGIARFRGASQ